MVDRKGSSQQRNAPPATQASEPVPNSADASDAPAEAPPAPVVPTQYAYRTVRAENASQIAEPGLRPNQASPAPSTEESGEVSDPAEELAEHLPASAEEAAQLAEQIESEAASAASEGAKAQE